MFTSCHRFDETRRTTKKRKRIGTVVEFEEREPYYCALTFELALDDFQDALSTNSDALALEEAAEVELRGGHLAAGHLEAGSLERRLDVLLVGSLSNRIAPRVLMYSPRDFE